jgi:hypothetical protein
MLEDDDEETEDIDKDSGKEKNGALEKDERYLSLPVLLFETAAELCKCSKRRRVE